MILYSSVENYRSIGEKQELSLVPNSDISHKEKLIFDGEEWRALPVIPIYGGNATGKTNILNGLRNLKELVTGMKTTLENYDRCKFIKKEQTTFEIVYVKNKVKYFYSISYSKNDVEKEFLYYYPNGRSTKIFDRTFDKITFGNFFENELKKTTDKVIRERSFLFVLGFWLKKNVVLQEAYSFFLNDLIFLNFEPNRDNIKNSKKELSESENQKKVARFMKTIFKELNTGIIGIGIGSFNSLPEHKEIFKKLIEEKKSFEIKFHGEETEIELSDKLLTDFLYNNENMVQLLYDIDGTTIGIPIEEESKGIQKIFMLGMKISEAICDKKVLLFDELETGFHPILAKKIIEIFMNDNQKFKSQLIFTTHDTNLLSLDLFRRDQIFFTEKTKKTKYQTKLKYLSKIKGIRKTTDIEKEYLKGNYCEFPQLNSLVDNILSGCDD